MSEAPHHPRQPIAPTAVGGVRDKDAVIGGAEGKPRPRRRRKVSYLTINKIDNVDYKEVNILRRFINEYGKILPARQTGNTAKQQRMITRAVSRAREMALLPFVNREMVDRRDSGRRGMNQPAPEQSAPEASSSPTEESPAVE